MDCANLVNRNASKSRAPQQHPRKDGHQAAVPIAHGPERKGGHIQCELLDVPSRVRARERSRVACYQMLCVVPRVRAREPAASENFSFGHAPESLELVRKESVRKAVRTERRFFSAR